MLGSGVGLIVESITDPKWFQLGAYTVALVLFAWSAASIALVSAFGLYRGWAWSWVSASALFIGSCAGAAMFWSQNTKVASGVMLTLCLHGLSLASRSAQVHCSVGSIAGLRRILYVSGGSTALLGALTWFIPTMLSLSERARGMGGS